MNFKFQISNFKYIGILLLLFSFIFAFMEVKSVSASSHCIAGVNVRGKDPNDLHRYTGKDCSAIRPKPGSIIGPGQFGDPKYYKCLGACKYQVNYCTSDGCEAVYPQPDCAQAPPQCSKSNTTTSDAIGDVFGKIIPPDAIINLGFGGLGISKFLSNLVTLIYSLAAVVLILMILWGAWDWLTSEGDKEKLESAKKKIINAIIGIMLFAVAFAIIQVLGTFTGFPFFTVPK